MSVNPQRFKRVRAAHQRETAEDYVEMIQDLIDEKGEARLTDIAQRFGVSNVTAHKILRRLKQQQLLHAQPYRAVFLTVEGKKMATSSRHRHHLVYELLLSLGVPSDVAKSDAEGIEHHVSYATLRAFSQHLAKRSNKRKVQRKNR